MSVLIFFLVLFVLILVHEWGHFIVAKKTSMRVDEFGIGFPPKLFGIKKGETKYTFNALPIGGFVRILGENMDEDGESLSEADKKRTFSARPKWAQVLVLVAGVAMNVLFAWLLFVVVLMVGVPTSVDETVATDAAELVVIEVVDDSPAHEAGLPIGAVITKVTSANKVLDSFTPNDFARFTESLGTESMTITYQTTDETREVSITPANGVLTDDPDRQVIGIRSSLIEVVSVPFTAAVASATVRTADTLVAITVGLSNLIAGAFTGTADLSQVAGPVGIVGLVGDAAEFGLTSLLVFTAVISLNLAVINMLPFPALDGGRLIMVAIETVIRRPLNPTWVANVNLAGFALLILLMVAVTFSDVSKLL